MKFSVSRLIGFLLVILAAILLVAVILPFNSLELLLDRLTFDNDFGLLKPENWTVFRVSFLTLGLLLAAQGG